MTKTKQKTKQKDAFNRSAPDVSDIWRWAYVETEGYDGVWCQHLEVVNLHPGDSIRAAISQVARERRIRYKKVRLAVFDA